MTRSLMVLFAIAGGAAVGSLYYAQPLLDLIARDLRVPQESAGLLVTASQIGYALGILFIVPLGDLRDRRRLVPLMMLLSAVALAACGIAPGFVTLTLAVAAVGVTTVSGQILAPLAGDLSDDASRGKVIGIVVSGLITGILVARIFSGVIAGLAGWRVVFLAAAGIAVILSVLLYRSIPHIPAKTTGSYLGLLRSVLSFVVRDRTLQVTMVLGATGFAVFTMFWTTLTFLLSNPPYSYPTSVIGLFGIAGLVGALAAQGAGRVHDRGLSTWGTGVSWLLIFAGFLVAGFGRNVLVLLLIGIVVLDIGLQAQHILNQSRLFQLAPSARSRVNTAYITGNFVGGTIGSLLSTVLWAAGGWGAITGAGAILSGAALLLWAATRNGALRLARPEPSPAIP
ncbi:MFS transporter [Actinocrispum sp. NPDC049592]|uniref:MFS transporter n=1 Tax=Actinocrispum sp. NPDC049592 TaxID=3154835 RepID=UPI00342B7851